MSLLRRSSGCTDAEPRRHRHRRQPRSHKGKPVRAALRAVGAKLFFLPAYSPDLNPIEMLFAKLKTLLREADERSVEATWRRIGELLGAFASQECAAYLRHAGYASALA